VSEHIAIATPSLIWVAWSCRRCGHTGGVARTTIPLETYWTESMGREMFAQLRQKLVRVHMKQGCIAVPDDFVLSRHVPDRSQELLGVVGG